MIKSLRGRLMLWYGGLILIVVAGLGGMLTYRTYLDAQRRIDARLESAAQVLEAGLTAFPAHELDPDEPQPPPPKKGKPPPPGRKKREDFLELLELPRDLRGYYAIWKHDDELVKAEGIEEIAIPKRIFEEEPSYWEDDDVRELTRRGPHQTQILVGMPTAKELGDVKQFALRVLFLSLAAVTFGMIGGWAIAVRMIRPIADISAAASKISADNLVERIDVDRLESELAGLGNVLNDTFARLESAFARQKQFTADASHELRTPLAILQAQAELALSRNREPAEYRITIEKCLKAAQRMTHLVEGLLTLARSDAGQPLASTTVSLHQVAVECLTQMKPLAEEKKVTLTAALEHVDVPGDADAILQVMLNLVGNAIRFNKPEGTVHLSVSATPAEAVLSVRDTGLGIPEADRAQLFERFYRVDKARSRAAGGTGLGLAICKALVEAQRGTIACQSQENVGTTFEVRLPRFFV